MKWIRTSWNESCNFTIIITFEGTEMSWIYIFQSYSENTTKNGISKLKLHIKNIEFKFVGLNLAFRWKLRGRDELNLRCFRKFLIHACFMHVDFWNEYSFVWAFMKEAENAKRVTSMIIRGNILGKFAIWENQLEFTTLYIFWI